MITFSLLESFLYYTLPILLLLYWRILPLHLRPLTITVLSSVILAACAPFFFLYVVSIAALVPRLQRLPASGKLHIAAFALGIFTIAFWKYMFGFYANAAAAFFSIPAVFTVIGVSFMGLRITGLVIYACTPHTPVLKFLDCLNFLTFFPTLTAGPLENMSGFMKGYTGNFDPYLFWLSLYKILFGLFKKLIVFEVFFNRYFAEILENFMRPDLADAASYAPGDIFLLCILMFLKVLLDISAYNDLARGMAGLFGYRIVNDIHYPLGVRDLSEYWRNWHISIMRWCQTHIYFPVLLWKKNITLAIFASLIVMGLWHDTEWKWFVWGLYQAAGLAILQQWNQFKAKHQYPSSVATKRIHAVIGPVLTFIFASLAFVIVGPDEFSRSLQLIIRLFGF